MPHPQGGEHLLWAPDRLPQRACRHQPAQLQTGYEYVLQPPQDSQYLRSFWKVLHFNGTLQNHRTIGSSSPTSP